MVNQFMILDPAHRTGPAFKPVQGYPSNTVSPVLFGKAFPSGTNTGAGQPVCRGFGNGTTEGKTIPLIARRTPGPHDGQGIHKPPTAGIPCRLIRAYLGPNAVSAQPELTVQESEYFFSLR